MSSVCQETKSQAVTLKGSAQLVKTFFHYGINSILYQRGIYPAESFARQQEYGLPLLVSTDEKVNLFLTNILSQIETWLVAKKIQKLVVVLSSVEKKEVLERWDFKIEYEEDDENSKENVDENEQNKGKKTKKVEKDETKIKQEIRDVIRQITASVTFLPLLDCPCTFDVLIHTERDLEVPNEWGESDACIIENSEEVKLRSFSTNIHRVEAAVSYKTDL